MRLIWAPPDGELREWEFDPDSLLTSDAEAVEALGGTVWEDFDEFDRLFRRGNRRALRAALWVLRRKTEPGLRFETIEVRADEVKYNLIGDTEKQVVRQRLIDGDVPNAEARELYVEILGEDPTASDPKAVPSDSPPPPVD
jgi:hypothetical protein